MATVSELMAGAISSSQNGLKVWGGIIINVKDSPFNAKGDGVKDDTEAIQKAIDYAISIGKKEITFPAGTYKYGTLINTEGITFIGDGVTLNGSTPLYLSSISALRTNDTQRGINVMSSPFYAKGDSVTDDTAAIQAAINAVSESGGGIVFFPRGTYKTTSTITIKPNVTLNGSGETSEIKTTLTSGCMFLADHVTNIGFDNLKFSGPVVNVHALDSIVSSTIRIKNCFAEGVSLIETMSETGATYNDINESMLNDTIIVESCVCYGSTEFGTDGCMAFVFSKNVIVTGNKVGNYPQGIMFWGGDSNPAEDGDLENTRWATNLVFTGNIVNGVGSGGIWGSMGDKITVTGNVTENCGDVGIDMEGTFNAAISGNTTKDCVNGGISTFHFCKGITISGNSCTTSVSDQYLVHIYNASQNSNNKDILITGNTFECTSGGIGLVGGDANESLLISNNIMRNVKISRNASGSRYVKISDNTLLFDVASSAAFKAIEIGGNMNGGRVSMDGNEIISNVTQPSGSTAIYESEYDFNTHCYSEIDNNKIYGFPKDIEVRSEGSNAGISNIFNLSNNTLETGAFTRHEGTSTSRVRLRNNKLYDGSPFPSAIPSSGKWDRGQQIEYPSPSASGKIGAVCVSAGTPGTWKEYGVIDA